MQTSIVLLGRQVEYELLRKRVKNINLRIRADGSVSVSAPKAVPTGTVEDFLRSKGEYILCTLDRFAALAVPELSWSEGESVPVLGRVRTLHVSRGGENLALLRRDCIELTVRDADDAALRERVFTKLLRELCRETVEGLCGEAYPRFERLGVAPPEIKLRRMKSRWGSCAAAKGVVTFNTALVYTPPDCVEYVVYHELTHFLHPDHSPEFYRCLAGFIPDWKQRRRRLNEYTAYISI